MATDNNQGLEDVLSPGITPALESFVPEKLRISGTITGNDKFKQLYKLVYNTVQVRQIHGGGQHLEITFCSLTPLELEPFRGCMPELGTVEANPVGFYHVLYMLSNATVQNTRPFRREVITLMTNDPVNALLRTNFAQPEDNVHDEDYLMTLFMRLVKVVLNTIAVLHQKARLGVTAYCWNKQLSKQLNSLEVLVQDMEYSLCSRADANDAAHKLVRYRAKTLETLKEYIELENPIHPTNTPMFLQEYTITGEFKFAGDSGLNKFVENRTLWHNFIVDPELDTNLIPEMITLKDTLKEIFKEIKSFVPNSLDAAADVAKNLRPVIINTCDEYDIFKASPTKTVGKASSLMKDIDGHRSTIQKLQGDGLIINEASVGTSQQNLQTMYAYLSDYVRTEEQKDRLAEAKAKIELQELSKASANVKLTISPLNGMMSWLAFLQSYDEIIPLHTSELVKAQVVRNALVNKQDRQYCQDLNHEDMMTYLRMKYDHPSLIPDLISQVINLPRASTYAISHNNICQFKQMCMHLKHHNAEYRLDGATRDKLIPVLLPEKLQVDFLKSRRTKEIEWKQRFDLDGPSEDDDNMSIAGQKDERLEELRRKHFIDEMTENLPIMRQLMKNVSEPSSHDERNKASLDHKTHARMGNFADETSTDSSKSDSDDENPTQDCPICFTVHRSKTGEIIESLGRCSKFRFMDPKMKAKVIRRTKYCPRCLRFKDPESHQHDSCSWADSRNLICYKHDTPTTSHHPILCNTPKRDKRGKEGEENKGEEE